jgi:hypothetical protein
VLLARSELDAIRRPAGGLPSNLRSSGACLKDSWQSGWGPGDGPSPPKFCALRARGVGERPATRTGHRHMRYPMATTNRRRLSNQERGVGFAPPTANVSTRPPSSCSLQMAGSDGFACAREAAWHGCRSTTSCWSRFPARTPRSSRGSRPGWHWGIACARARARFASSPRCRSRTETTTASQTRRLSRGCCSRRYRCSIAPRSRPWRAWSPRRLSRHASR